MPNSVPKSLINLVFEGRDDYIFPLCIFSCFKTFAIDVTALSESVILH